MSKLTILDKAAVIRNETQPLANTRGRVADVLEDIANTLVDEAALNNEATARDQGDQDNANAIADEATARANGDAMKLDKPNSDGSYYIAKTTVAGIPYYQYRVINLSSGQIPVSMGSYIGASLLYESVSGRIGLDTPNPSEKFEVYNGRVKSDGFILTSSAVSPLPKEIKFKGGNFVGAKDDGIERKFLMEGDVSESEDLLVDYTHTANKEIYFSSIDYSTGLITTTIAHGLTGRTRVIPCPNIDAPLDLATNFLSGIIGMAWEYMLTDLYVDAIDSTTLKICTSAGAVITVDVNSAQNLGYINSTTWHLEVYSALDINLPNLPKGINRIYADIVTFSIVSLIQRYFQLKYYDSSNNIITVANSNSLDGRFLIYATPTQNSVRNAILSNIRMNINNTGGIANASIYESIGTRGMAANKANLIYTAVNWGGTGNFRGYSGNGIAQLFLPPTVNFFSNGAKIKIYKA